MKADLSELIQISQHYGKDKDFIIAGGGNTSYKNKKLMYIKASGISLGNINDSGFVCLNRKKVKSVMVTQYSEEPFKREQEIKEDLLKSRKYPKLNQRPSVETSLHEMIDYSYIVHTHPCIVNAVLCSQNSRETIFNLFGEDIVYVPYTDPGYTLAIKVQELINEYRSKNKQDPHIIFLENHGIIVSANTCEEIQLLYDRIISTIKDQFNFNIKNLFKLKKKSPFTTEIIRYLQKYLKEKQKREYHIVHNNSTLSSFYYVSYEQFKKIELPFTPDIIVYCKHHYIYINDTKDIEELKLILTENIELFMMQYGFYPKIILLKNIGVFSIDETEISATHVLEMFEDQMKISYFSEYFEGPKFLSPQHIKFIDEWEVENYRRQIAKKGI